MAESEQLLHHQKQEYCSTRPAYREGRRLKAVKVYTVNDESRYLIVQGVPAVGASEELLQLCALYGRIVEYRILDEYPTADQFTDVFWIKYEQIQSARIAKRKLDDRSFFGGVLHVCYAPECESVEETREKLVGRRKAIAAKCREYGYDSARVGGPSNKGQAREEEDPGTSQLSPLLDGKSSSSDAAHHAEAGRHIEAPLAAPALDSRDRGLHADGGKPEAAAAARASVDSNEPCCELGVQLTGPAASYPSTERYPLEWPAVPPAQPAGQRTTTARAQPTTGATTTTCNSVPAAVDAAAWQRHTFSGVPGVSSARQNVVVSPDITVPLPRTVRPNRGPAVPPRSSSTERTAAVATSGSALAARRQDGALLAVLSRKPADGGGALVQTAAPVVRPYRASTAQPPKFVPRQAASHRGPASAAGAAAAASSSGGSRSLDAELKLNAAVLGKPQGPTLPGLAAQGGLEGAQRSLTGSESLDKTVFDIRYRIRKVTASAVTVRFSWRMHSQHGSEQLPHRRRPFRADCQTAAAVLV